MQILNSTYQMHLSVFFLMPKNNTPGLEIWVWIIAYGEFGKVGSQINYTALILFLFPAWKVIKRRLQHLAISEESSCKRAE